MALIELGVSMMAISPKPPTLARSLADHLLPVTWTEAIGSAVWADALAANACASAQARRECLNTGVIGVLRI